MDLRISVLAEQAHDLCRLLIRHPAHDIEEPNPQAAQQAKRFVEIGTAHQLIGNPRAAANIRDAFAQVDAVLGEHHGPSCGSRSHRCGHACVAGAGGVIHLRLRQPVHRASELPQGLDQEAQRPVEVEEALVRGVAIIDLDGHFPRVVMLPKRIEAHTRMFADVLKQSAHQFQIVGIAGGSTHAQLAHAFVEGLPLPAHAAEHPAIGCVIKEIHFLQALHIGREFIFELRRWVLLRSEVKEREGPLREHVDDLMHPGGHTAGHIRVGALEHETNVCRWWFGGHRSGETLLLQRMGDRRFQAQAQR